MTGILGPRQRPLLLVPLARARTYFSWTASSAAPRAVCVVVELPAPRRKVVGVTSCPATSLNSSPCALVMPSKRRAGPRTQGSGWAQEGRCATSECRLPARDDRIRRTALLELGS